jgi:hypothetical protein
VVAADPQTAIGSALGNAQAIFAALCTLMMMFLTKLLFKGYNSKQYLKRVTDVEEQHRREIELRELKKGKSMRGEMNTFSNEPDVGIKGPWDMSSEDIVKEIS